VSVSLPRRELHQATADLAGDLRLCLLPKGLDAFLGLFVLRGEFGLVFGRHLGSYILL